MTSIALDHPREDAKTIIKASLERMGSIDAYTDEGQRIVGKQEASLMGGNGARLIVDVPEMQESEEKTVIEANAEKEVSIDMATNPEDIKSNFLNTVNVLRKRDVDDLLDEMSQEMTPEDSKEVASSGSFGDTQSTLGKRFIIMFVVLMVFTLLFGVMMTAVMMP
ncbi:hypothetical protein [Halobacterium salinarum]|uniref:hypothetical protein n=1 Tax=Halobacterium salinarum TaxID=2242 RepID=UPI002552D861|nr:hypothetical protein [Halobacterium salinarum]MDL0145798.1 hypothetical protein [Halobacterium salinarum]